MKKLFNKKRVENTTDSRTYHITTTIDPDIYVDECWKYYGRRKQILPYQSRMYKTWKHNRKTQWKEEK